MPGELPPPAQPLPPTAMDPSAPPTAQPIDALDAYVKTQPATVENVVAQHPEVVAPVTPTPEPVEAPKPLFSSDGRLKVITPTGELWGVEPGAFPSLAPAGWRMATPEDLYDQTVKETVDGPVGKIAAASGAAMNMLTAGAWDTGLKKWAPATYKTLQAAEEVNPGSALTGSAAGLFGLPGAAIARAGEVVGDAALPYVPAIVAKAVETGTEGMLVSLPQAGTQLLTGEPQDAAESLMHGAEWGAGLGLAGPLLGKLLGAAKDSMPPLLSDMMKNAQRREGMQRIGMTDAMLKRIGLDRADDLINVVDRHGGFRALQSPEETYNIIEELRDEAGKGIAGIYKGLDKDGITVPDSIQARLADELHGIEKSHFEFNEKGEVLQSQQTAFNQWNKVKGDILDKVNSRDDSFVGFWDRRKAISDAAKWEKVNPTGAMEPIRQAERAMQNALIDSVKSFDAYGADSGAPRLSNELQQLNAQYADFATLSDPLERAAIKEAKKGLLGLKEAVMGVFGGEIAGLPGAITGLVMNHLREQFGAPLAYTSLKTMNRLIVDRDTAINGAVAKFFDSPVGARAEKVLSTMRALPTSVDVLQRLYPEEKDAEPKELHQKFLDNVAPLMTNPQEFNARVTHYTQGIGDFAPPVQDALHRQVMSAIQFLYGSTPKPATPPSPFNQQEYVPSDAELASFRRRLAVAMNPYAVLTELNDGSLTSDSTAALATIYPAFYTKLQHSLLKQATEKPTTLPFQKRLQISLLFGRAVDPATNPANILTLQRAFAVSSQPPQAKTNLKFSADAQSQTDIQKAARG